MAPLFILLSFAMEGKAQYLPVYSAQSDTTYMLPIDDLLSGRIQAKKDTIVLPFEKPVLPSDSLPKGYVKTNLLPWLFLQANVAVEFDLGRHWSANLPIVYSGANYGTYSWRFRIFGFQPGVRYWTSPLNQGFFFGAHAGVAWFDFAYGGAYRYQDHDRHTPAAGGGLSIGYRLPTSANHRWWLEAEFGLGVYSVHYDRFVNHRHGRLVDSKKTTRFMPDILSLTIGYSFNLKKGGTGR